MMFKNYNLITQKCKKKYNKFYYTQNNKQQIAQILITIPTITIKTTTVTMTNKKERAIWIPLILETEEENYNIKLRITFPLSHYTCRCKMRVRERRARGPSACPLPLPRYFFSRIFCISESVSCPALFYNSLAASVNKIWNLTTAFLSLPPSLSLTSYHDSPIRIFPLSFLVVHYQVAKHMGNFSFSMWIPHVYPFGFTCILSWKFISFKREKMLS